jgi:hypothetical protein
MAQQYLPLIIPVLIFALIMRRGMKAQKVRLNAMWIRPAIILVLTVGTLVASPIPGLIAIAAFVAAAAIGAVIGYLRGRHLEFSIDTATGIITSKATQLGTILIGAVFALRFGLRYMFPRLAANPGGHLNRDAIAWSNGSLIFLSGMILAQVITVFIRTRPLLAQHAAAKVVSGPTQP